MRDFEANRGRTELFTTNKVTLPTRPFFRRIENAMKAAQTIKEDVNKADILQRAIEANRGDRFEGTRASSSRSPMRSPLRICGGHAEESD
ncbi:hypothetical protein LTR17_001013 [Elasticomyces elasticus]|nr:hypothetical protein LTR17_001013 [Elasticomyces elasticus]